LLTGLFLFIVRERTSTVRERTKETVGSETKEPYVIVFQLFK